jgi:hypothetical protein
MAKGAAFASGFAQGASNVTALLFQKRLREKEAEQEEARRIAGETRLFGRQQTILAGERAEAAGIRGEAFREKYGLPPAALRPLGPGEQGPTPAGPAELEAAIQGAPSFLLTKAETTLKTSEEIRQQAARQAGEDVLSLPDLLRLGGDIQRAYGEAIDAVTAIAATPDGMRQLASYDADPFKALNKAAAMVAKPAIDQIIALVPSAERGRIVGIQGIEVVPPETLRAQLRAGLHVETDPARARAAIASFTQALKDLGQVPSQEDSAAAATALARIEQASTGVEGFGSPTWQRILGHPFGVLGPSLEGTTGFLGRIRGPVATAARGLASQATRTVPIPFLRAPAVTTTKPAPLGAAPTITAPKPVPKRPKIATTSAAAEQIKAKAEAYQALIERETVLLARARQDLLLGGAIRIAIEEELRQVQDEIRRRGGTPQPLEVGG